MTSSRVTSAPTDPEPLAWLTTERLSRVKETLGQAKTLLITAGMWRAALSYWVRLEASLEIDFSSKEDQDTLNLLESSWLKKNSLEEWGLSQVQLRDKLRVAPASMRWARKQWSNRLETVFLKRKSELDRASCKLLRTTDKDLIKELYHRIKAGETTFEEAARSYGKGSERKNGGLIPMQSLEEMPHGLGPLLSTLEPGGLSIPLQLGKSFCIVELTEWKPCQLDEDTKDFLLSEQLRLWIDFVVDTLLSILGSNNE